MEANELRIGNYVQYEEQLFYAIEDGIDIDAASIYHPIPLTEEWLVKFGFKKEKVNDLYDSAFIRSHVLQSELYLRPSNEGGYYWGFNTPDALNQEFYDCKPIKYVHQLQNLYFSFTGKELKRKE